MDGQSRPLTPATLEGPEAWSDPADGAGLFSEALEEHLAASAGGCLSTIGTISSAGTICTLSTICCLYPAAEEIGPIE